MSIYVTKTNDPKLLGIAHAMEAVIEEAFFFDLNTLDMFDFIQKKKPKVVLLEMKDIEKCHINYVKQEYPDIKFILFNKGAFSLEEDIFDLVINTTIDREGEMYLPNLVDTTICRGGEEKRSLKCDFAMFTDRVDDNNPVLCEWLEILGQAFNLKVFGSKKIDCSYYLGDILEENIKNLYKSTKGLIMVEDSNIENCIENNIAPINYSYSKDGEYEWDSLDKLMTKCEKVLNENKTSYGKTKGTYIDFVNRIREELKI